MFYKIEEDYLEHYGMPRRSGRYPWGSGKNPFQRTPDFLVRVDSLKKQGMTSKQIADSFGISTTAYRAYLSLAKAERRRDDINRAKSLRDDGLNNSEIGRQMGVPESTIRYWFDSENTISTNKAVATADFIKDYISKNGGLVDVGKGVERDLGISKERLDQALHILEEEGYEILGGRVEQATNPGKFTTFRVIGPPGTPPNAPYDFENIHSLKEYSSVDGGETYSKMEYPASMDSNRLAIRYAEEGGADMDGVIEIRRGVQDLSLGNSHYAQVRILVDESKYLKGMAVYSDDLPEGIDIRFNTNKHVGTPKLKVLKDIDTSDPNNPFGSLIKANGQSKYIDENGNEKLSLINKRADEGDWDSWSDELPSQFLAKQSLPLIKQQLNLTIADKQEQFNEIMSLENKVVKRTMLSDFAEDCDASAVYLKAMALPRQKYQVILPVNSMKDNEIYAPNYKDGETVALVRYPHGGTFEIPILKVNNKNQDGKKMIGENPLDAVGINAKVASILSGADFDGDTVMVIPTGGKNKIISTKPLEGLKGYDPKDIYGATEEPKIDINGKKHYFRNGVEYKVISKSAHTELEMGKITNLITDMTAQGASEEELARAVRHSMTVIDAAKHHLDYKASERDNNIRALKVRS